MSICKAYIVWNSGDYLRFLPTVGLRYAWHRPTGGYSQQFNDPLLALRIVAEWLKWRGTIYNQLPI